MKNKTSKAMIKTKRLVFKYRKQLLAGKVIAIDPSCISGKDGSKPAYAVFQDGVYVEQGILDVKYTPLLAIRLQGIAECIRTHLTNVSAVIVEDTPYIPIRTKAQAVKSGKTYMNAKNIASLKQAIGAIKAAFQYGTPVIDVNPLVWYAIARQNGWTITKEDSDDARLIGLSVFKLLTETMTGEKPWLRQRKKQQ